MSAGDFVLSGAACRIIRICDKVPASNDTFKVTPQMMPAGAYRARFICRSNVTGTTTAFAFTPYVDAAQAQLADSSLVVFRSNVNPGGAFTIAAATGPNGFDAILAPHAGGTIVQVSDPVIVVPYGLLVSITKGTATTDQLLEGSLVLCPVMPLPTM